MGEQKKARVRSLSLAAKMVLLSAGLAGALAAGLTLLGYRKAAAGLRAKSELALGSDASLTATLTDNWMAERVTALRGVADLRSVRIVLDTAVALAREDVDVTNQALSDIASVAPEIESIEVIDLAGHVIAGTTDEVQARPLLERPEVQSALAGHEVISGVSTSPTTGAPCVYTAVPAIGTNGTVVGVVRSRESIDRIQALVAAARSRIGASAQGVLLDGDGLVVATTVDPSWRRRPVAALDPAALATMAAEGRWGAGGAPASIGALELAAVRGAQARRTFAWHLGDTAYLAIAEPLPRTRWTYVAGLPLADVNRAAQEFLYVAVLAAAVGLLIATALSVVQARRMVGSLARLSEVSRRIVAEADLTQTVEVDGDDEIAALARNFGRMVDALREALTRLRQSAATLDAAAENLQRTTNEQDEFLARQAAALQQTQVTAQEIKQTSSLAAEKAGAVLQAAEHADEVGRTGAAAAESGVAGFTAIRGEAAEIGDRIRNLSEAARQIGGITLTVKDLADQSNMLALNAAIEAVRSGEHGRGFAVVAREIRSLADQSIEATSRVNRILADLGGAISATTRLTDAGIARMESGLGNVRASGDNLRELAEITRKNVEAVRQIAAAVTQQNAGIVQIFSAVTDQMRMMDATRVSLEKTSAASKDLREVASGITRAIERYRT